MSKFIDKLKQVSTAAPQSMGFRTQQSAPSKRKMLLIAAVSQNDIEADYLAGADAGLLDFSLCSRGNTLKNISRAIPDIPWGGRMRDMDKGEIKEITKSVCDFLVIPSASTPLTVIQDDETGKILEVEPTISDSLLRAANQLPVDAVLIAGQPAEFLTWNHLLLFQRFADLLAKPCIVPVPAKVTAKELQALCEIGVAGILVAVGGEQPAGRLKELQQIVDKLTPPRKREKVTPLIPYTGGEATSVDSEEEEEE